MKRLALISLLALVGGFASVNVFATELDGLNALPAVSVPAPGITQVSGPLCGTFADAIEHVTECWT
jgi:hypothetical protein